jgi:hypothetical protein
MRELGPFLLDQRSPSRSDEEACYLTQSPYPPACPAISLSLTPLTPTPPLKRLGAARPTRQQECARKWERPFHLSASTFRRNGSQPSHDFHHLKLERNRDSKSSRRPSKRMLGMRSSTPIGDPRMTLLRWSEDGATGGFRWSGCSGGGGLVVENLLFWLG